MFSTILNNMLYIQWGVVISASLVAAICDMRSRRIPNILTMPLFVTGILMAAITRGLPGALESLGSTVILALPFILLYAFAGGGAGDAKLMGAIGAWLGITHGLVVLATVSIIGGIIGLIYAAFHKQLRPVLRRFHSLSIMALTYIRFNKGKGMAGLGAATVSTDQMLYMPYGLAIFCGVFVAAIGAFAWPL